MPHQHPISRVRGLDVLAEARRLRDEHRVLREHTHTLAGRLCALRAEILEVQGQVIRLQSKFPRLGNEGMAAAAATEPANVESLVDVEILEDRDLLSSLNALGFDCDKCGCDEPLVAVACFVADRIAMGLCGDCFREMKEMSRGEVA